MSESRLQVAVLAGGLGSRLRPLTEKIPKPMVEVSGQPFLYWQLRDLQAQGFKNVLLLVAYLGEQIEAHFGNGASLGLNISYAYEKEPLGTGGALKNALGQLEKEFILLNGDSFLKTPLQLMADAFHVSQDDAMVSVYDNHDPVPVIPNLKVASQKVTAYEKDAGLARGFDKIDSGIYILKRSLIARQKAEKFMLADLWKPLIAGGTMGAFEVNERFYDIGTVERLKEFEDKVHDYFPHSISR